MRGVLLAAALCVCAIPASAHAAGVPANGRLALTAGLGLGRADIVTVKSNGKGWTDLTPGDHPAYCSPAWSPDGTRIAFLEPADAVAGRTVLHVMNADGTGARLVPLARPSPVCESLSWSADGGWIAYSAGGGGVEAIRADGLGPGLTVTDGESGYHNPKWSNDGSRIVYLAEDGHTYATPVSRVGPALAFGAKQQIDQHGPIGGHPDWSPDDSRLVATWEGADARGLWTVSSSDGGAAVPLTTNALNSEPTLVDDYASWSPDGRKIAFWRGTYTANGAGIGQGIFVVDAGGGAPLELIAAAGDVTSVAQPDWQPLPRGS
ncbi:MAG TPA: hypothetical protein VJT75_11280 [Thermoleophilaceae bacterium]|nr:hypothetical protein [Thermoleophilaceae bacterium]